MVGEMEFVLLMVFEDGNNAPPPIKFEIEEAEEKRLPVPKFNFFGVDNECQSLVMRFIEQYIQLFDSNERSNLIEAYHDRVTFSTSFWFYPDENAKQHRFDIGSSRNLMRIPPQERNGKRVHYGKEAVVKFLAEEFPETNHLMETINADVIHHSPQMLSFTITGLYEESRSSKSFKVTRLFSRNFTAVYQGAGIVIISEQLSFSNANPDRRGRMVANGSKRSAAALSSQPSVSTVSAPVDETAQNAMVQRFMVDSGMNAHYSRECLVVHNWNYEEAGKKFTILKAEGKIPPDAYC
ncbi:NXF1 [Bugula neritina]|uniref:NXF1 n=1 Tax=Bugula neritina TaxID=10212 RepID=A0A7J7K8D4_BUGNE|nr:NXF1 [Bugula neritina]